MICAIHATRAANSWHAPCSDHSVMGTGSSCESSIGIGAAVGAYRLGEPIGAGGMGVVFEAQLDGGERVAVKVLRREWLADDAMVRRFRVEAIAGHLVRHPNVVAVIDRGETKDGVPFLVMKRVPGESLGFRLEHGGPLPARRAAAIVRQLLSALDAIHRAGVVHGDVKSDNVLVETLDDGAEAATLIDFGLALIPVEARPHELDLGLVAGTPEYMAPEVICGGGASRSSDLYAVGVILYELLTGVTPFGGRTAEQILQQHLEKAVVPPSRRATGLNIPRVFECIVMRALEKDRHARYPSARAFGLALDSAMRFLDEVPAAAAPGFDRTRSDEAPTLSWRRAEPPITVRNRRRFAAGTL
jgi:serine/threonine protein kinase